MPFAIFSTIQPNIFSDFLHFSWYRLILNTSFYCVFRVIRWNFKSSNLYLLLNTPHFSFTIKIKIILAICSPCGWGSLYWPCSYKQKLSADGCHSGCREENRCRSGMMVFVKCYLWFAALALPSNLICHISCVTMCNSESDDACSCWSNNISPCYVARTVKNNDSNYFELNYMEFMQTCP